MLLIWRFVTILLVALTLGLSFAHTLEMPAKMLYEGGLYITIQRSLYAAWGPPNIGGFLEPAAVVAAVVLCAAVRHRKRAFWLSTAAAVALLAAFPLVYFILVEPVNEILRTTSAIPANWEQLRSRWETGHAVRCLLQLIALSLMLLSVLFETGKRKFMSKDF
ncbi:MAG TPA: anthrone oxygenase family protein [Gammaproteobacteria bacterium]|nr:anthrone oxygenase family protein [Gammaproteobacteria bacterium]